MFAVMKRLLCVLALVLPVAAVAQQDPAERARAAIEVLDAARAQLDDATSARDRVRALTETTSALEEGLTALRAGLRQAALREAELSAKLQTQNDQTAALLAVLQQIADTSKPIALLHPGGPTGTARAGMLLSELAPALNTQAATLRQDLHDLKVLREVQTEATDDLESGLQAVQLARTTLTQAIADRTELPKRFINDPVREAILIASAQTLSEFAEGLDLVSVDLVAAAPETLDGEKGELPLPVAGRVLRSANEPDAAGIIRPGVLLETIPGAIVTTPVPATIRYTGPLLDFGQVVILEPQADVLFVLAGLETIYGAAGDVIDRGAPLGLMGGQDHKNAAELSTDSDEAGASRVETLYIEVRQENEPEDPSLWFRLDKNG